MAKLDKHLTFTLHKHEHGAAGCAHGVETAADHGQRRRRQANIKAEEEGCSEFENSAPE